MRHKFIRAKRSPEKTPLVPHQTRRKEPETGNRQFLKFHGESDATESWLTGQRDENGTAPAMRLLNFTDDLLLEVPRKQQDGVGSELESFRA